MSARPLQGLRVALVGSGRVGSSVARWLLGRGAGLEVVARRDEQPLPRWAAAAGARAVDLEALCSDGQDLLLLAIPDGAVGELAASLASRPQAAVVLHTSGLLSAEALAPLRAAGAAVGGFHPLRAFPRALPSLAVARRTFFALQGDAAACALGARMATALGASSAYVPGPARPLYHLAATWAAGGVVTMLGAAADLHAAAGVPAAAAAALRELARGALEAADASSPVAALTGPVMRGDGSLLAQLEVLRDTLPELHPLAVLVALEGLRQLAAKGSLTPSQRALRSALRELCGQPSFLDPLQTWV